MPFTTSDLLLLLSIGMVQLLAPSSRRDRPSSSWRGPRWRASHPRTKAWIDRATGLFLGALGLRLLWTARRA